MSGGLFKETPADAAVRERVYQVTADELLSYVERIEALNNEAKAVADDRAAVFAEAKARGYDTKALRRLIADRKRNPDDVLNDQNVLDLYRETIAGRDTD